MFHVKSVMITSLKYSVSEHNSKKSDKQSILWLSYFGNNSVRKLMTKLVHFE